MPPERDINPGGFLILIDFATPFTIRTQESPMLTLAEVAAVKAFLRKVIAGMESEERRKTFELWINPNPPGTGGPEKTR